jgi:hypothetical protein
MATLRVRDAKNNERHVCARRRDGEPAGSVVFGCDNEPRTKLVVVFSSLSEVADGALQHRHLRDRVAGAPEFGADLILKIGGIADLLHE